MEIAFLFGSGISIKAGYPSTDDITKTIFSGRKVLSLYDESFRILEDFPDSNDKTYKEKIPSILKFLEILKNEYEYFYKFSKKKTINYEDVYYLLSELINSDSGKIQNPAIELYKRHLEPSIIPLLKYDNIIPIRYNDLLQYTERYIADVATNMLLCDPHKKYEYLRFLKDSFNDDQIDKSYIFTLNHDILLEKYFENEKINIIDGFSEHNKDNFRFLDLNSYKMNKKSKTVLIKVHGSVSWWYNSRYQQIIELKDGYPYDSDYYGSATILIGTYNKLKDYTTISLFMDLHYLFIQYLENVNYLVISGYSFGDIGINSIIKNWMNKKKSSKIIIIHPRFNNLLLKAKISFEIKDWVKEVRVININKRIEKINGWQDIKSKMGE